MVFAGVVQNRSFVRLYSHAQVVDALGSASVSIAIGFVLGPLISAAASVVGPSSIITSDLCIAPGKLVEEVKAEVRAPSSVLLLLQTSCASNLT